jgi:hypothetical protein
MVKEVGAVHPVLKNVAKVGEIQEQVAGFWFRITGCRFPVASFRFL